MSEDEKQNESDYARAVRTGLSSVAITDQESAAVQKTPHRVTLESLVEKVREIEYLSPKFAPHMTICVCLLENGFMVVGTSTPADPQNFDADLGMRFAYEDCIRQMWKLEAYLLRERMSL